MFEVKVIKDSISPGGVRLTTLTATYPRMIHSELMTHRAFARSAASSRAIPFEKTLASLEADPFIPIFWGMEKPGMQTGEEIPEKMRGFARDKWLSIMRGVVKEAKELRNIGISFGQQALTDGSLSFFAEEEEIQVHKSIVNRMLEPWSWITTLITATEWNNFYRLRCHTDAEIHFQKIAGMIRDAREESKTCGFVEPLAYDQWHLPFVDHADFGPINDWIVNEADVTFSTQWGGSEAAFYEACRRVSTARCARVSYLNHDSQTRSISKDMATFNKLYNGSGFGHWAPFEHVAKPQYQIHFSGPFRGWYQYRKDFQQENQPG